MSIFNCHLVLLDFYRRSSGRIHYFKANAPHAPLCSLPGEGAVWREAMALKAADEIFDDVMLSAAKHLLYPAIQNKSRSFSPAKTQTAPPLRRAAY
jgi:hypothetical protein